MGLKFGILFGVMAKKMKKPLQRLKKFQLKIQSKSAKETTLYQYPSKMIFSILVIILIGLCFQWFAVQFQVDLMENNNSQYGSEIVLIYPQEQNRIQQLDNQERNTTNFFSYQQSLAHKQALQLRKILNIIHFLQLVGLLTLLFNINLKKIQADKRTKEIKVIEYSMLGLKTQKTRYSLKENDKLQIWKLGQNRFTNTNYYYSIRIVDENGSWQVIQRSSMYNSRTTIIQLGTILEIPFSIKIIKQANINVDQ